MPIDTSARARVLGIDVQYADLRGGGITFLPQRVAVLAQGSTDATYEATKFRATSAAEVGQKVGFGSPAHLITRQLLPANGDGVGTVPVTIYPLPNVPGATPSISTLTAVGTQTTLGTYRASIGGVLSQPFLVRANATPSDAYGAFYTAIQSVLEMPVVAELAYGTPASAAGPNNTGDGTISAVTVTGAPASGTYTLTCTVAAVNGGTFSLRGPQGGTVPGAIVLSGTPSAATPFDVGGIAFSITDGAADFVIGDSFTITIPANSVTLTSKWSGASANALGVSIEGPDAGIVWAIVQPTGGALNPDLALALAQFGGTWETLVINALEVEDTAALNALQEFGEGRWGQLERKPFVAFVGNTTATVDEAIEPTSPRKDDRINCQLVAPASPELPFVVCARQVARIAKMANNNPPTDYGAQRATGLVPGPDAYQWNYVQRDQAVKNGCSTIEVKDGVINISDVVTFYHPTGEDPPGYSYVVDIVKLQNIIYSFDREFSKVEWNGAPLIPDDSPTVNPLARKPKNAKAAAAALLDSLALYAILAESKDAKASMVVGISAQNPKRLDIQLTVQLSGNLNINSIDLAFGFYFGTLAAIAA